MTPSFDRALVTDERLSSATWPGSPCPMTSFASCLEALWRTYTSAGTPCVSSAVCDSPGRSPRRGSKAPLRSCGEPRTVVCRWRWARNWRRSSRTLNSARSSRMLVPLDRPEWLAQAILDLVDQRMRRRW